jgi:hypothetical protein
VNDPRQKCQLRSVPGHFSGPHIVWLMYATFKILNPAADSVSISRVSVPGRSR